MTSHAANRRGFLAGTAAIGTAVVTARLDGAPSARRNTSAPHANRAPLAPQPFYSLPVGAVRPSGWLRRQLQIQADGMGGHIDETWPDLGPDSGWLGGKGESWERGPYFLDGLVPLAWMLDSAPLKAKAQKFIDWTLDNPAPDGMIGPRSNDDWWPRMVMLKVLTQYHELTGDPRVVPVMTGYFHHQLAEMPARPLRDWGRFRWQDEVVSLFWLYNRTGDAKLLELAELLKAQGFDWEALFAGDYPYRGKTDKVAIGLDKPDVPGEVPNGLKDPALSVHGVNNAQGLKASPVWAVMSGKAADRAAVHRQLDILDRYHGLPIGIYAADEHLAGRSPSQGVELCAIVEAMYSLELALAITGDAAIGDRIERIAYNALQATFTDDMWAHQYDQQPNQIRCAHEKGPWTTNGPEANLFGLEPNFGCCTANFHQGWPKLVASLWMASDGGLAATLYGPCEVSTTVAGVPVAVREETEYPFREAIAIHVDPERPVRFPLSLRVPGWATGVRINVNGKAVAPGKPGTFARIERQWRAGDRVDLVFTGDARRVSTPEGSFVEQGPLVFALPIDEKWQKLRDRGLTADWAVLPQGEWRYALAEGSAFRRVERPVGPIPFSRRSPPVVLVTEGYRVTDWPEQDNAAALPPAVPQVHGRSERLVLMPYAAPKLRITMFPLTRRT